MQYVPLLIAIVFSSAVGRIAQKSLDTLLWRFDVRRQVRIHYRGLK